MKILHLVVMGKYFDQFKAGTKDTEYRAYNDYWIARIMKDPRRGEELPYARQAQTRLPPGRPHALAPDHPGRCH